jgi:AraC-like DNA-binding protein
VEVAVAHVAGDAVGRGGLVEILATLRKRLPIQYLRTSRMKTEGIAASPGFSDAANTHGAFRRWTDRSPSDCRSRGGGPGGWPATPSGGRLTPAAAAAPRGLR